MEETGEVIRQGNHQPFAILSFPFSPTFSLSLSSPLFIYPSPLPAWHSLHVVSLIVTRSPLLSQTYFFTRRNESGEFLPPFSAAPSPPISPFVSAEAREIGDIFRATANTREIKVAPPLSLLYTRTSIYLSLPFENAASANGNVAVSPPSWRRFMTRDARRKYQFFFFFLSFLFFVLAESLQTEENRRGRVEG